MLADLIKSVRDEIKSLYTDVPATILFINQIKLNEDLMSYSMPLIVIGLNGNETAKQLLNGAHQDEYKFFIRFYDYSPNIALSPDEDYSIDLYDEMEKIETHFDRRIWNTQQMIDTQNNYSFNLTFEGESEAPDLKVDNGLCYGHQINYNSIAIDQSTMYDNFIQGSYDLIEGEIIIES
jgi:hypothetical protein